MKDLCHVSCFKLELRAEAVKRAVHFREKKDLSMRVKDFKYWQGRYEEVMDNFNLTEEDLK